MDTGGRIVTSVVAAPAPSRSAVPLAAALAVLAALLTAASFVLYALTHQDVVTNGGQNVMELLAFGTVGFVVASRRPSNPIGWLVLGCLTFELLFLDGGLYATLSRMPGYRLPTGPLLWLLAYSWFSLGVLPLVILLFPDGKLPSPRWRWPLRVYLTILGGYAVAVYSAVLDVSVGRHPQVEPDGQLAALSNSANWAEVLTRIISPVFAAFWLSFVVAQALSWRRSSGERRQQLKWLLMGASVLAFGQLLSQVGQAADPTMSPLVSTVLNVVTSVCDAALPVGLAIAILRYRLYDIDRIISRTLAYAVVTAVLAGLYAGLVLVATQVLDLTSQVAVAAATLAAAALFNPLRRRVQHRVDRRFNRARYDADNTVAAFATRLQDATDPDAVRSDLIGTVCQALEPARVSLWLAGGAR
jgi:hypothetical protein